MNDSKNHITPPRLAQKLLLWFLKDELAEEVQGDLEEKFYQTLTRHSITKARRNHWCQVLNYLRPFAIKSKTKNRLNNTAMFKHNLLISYRSFLRFKGTFAINMIGLSSGLAATLLIYWWVFDELQVDRFHQKSEQLYQVMRNVPSANTITTLQETPGLLARTLKAEIPEILHASSVSKSDFSSGRGLISNGDMKFKARGLFADQDFFEVFTLEIIQGSQKNPIKDKSQVIISEPLAKKLLPSARSIIGKSIEWEHERFNGTFIVSGVFKPLPKSASIQTDIIFDYRLFLENNPKLRNWGNSDPSTYLILDKGASIDAIEKKALEIFSSHKSGSTESIFLQNYADRYLFGNYVDGKPKAGRIVYIRLFVLIAVLILVNACINFINLSTAQASHRSKEIGMRKVMGAKRRDLIYQFYAESIMTTFLALILAIVLVAVFLPAFNNLTGKNLSFEFSSQLILGILGTALITGLLNGSYPSIYLSRFKIESVIKGKNNPPKRHWSRTGLVVFQNAASCLLIIASLVIYQQTTFIKSKNLGYKREDVILFENGALPKSDSFESNMTNFLSQLRDLPGVINATNFRHSITNRQGGTTSVSWPGKSPDDKTVFTDLPGGYGFIETLGINMKTGRAYSKHLETDQSAVVFNEKAIEVMGLEDPVGQVVNIWGEDKTIIGVTEDFHFQSFYEEIKPLFFDLSINARVSKIMVKIEDQNQESTLARIEELYNEYNQGHVFEFTFLDHDYNSLYKSENQTADLSKVFTTIALIISALGLLSLSAFTITSKRKEIGIRKAIGGSFNDILFLLTRKTLLPILFSMLIAIPMGIYFSKLWLSSFAYGVELSLGTVLLAIGGMLVIGILVTGYRTIFAALENPVKSLRSE